MEKITPFLWFKDNAEEAVNFYLSVFKNSKILKTTTYDENSAKATGQKKGTIMTIDFEINGQEFTAINGGPAFKFTEAVSFVVHCKNQEEVDHYWDKLSHGGEKSMCGWLKDKYGLSWQITPTILLELMTSTDKSKSQKAMEAMLKMSKIDIAKLKEAVESD